MSYEAGTYDIYDDGGLLLRELVPDQSELPEFVKLATQMSQDNNPNLFALVMAEDGNLSKRFPTVDAGNTWLSTLYFSRTHEDLPEEAQKVAAANLIEACEAHDIDVPNFLFELAQGPTETNFVDVTGTKPKMKVAAQRESEAHAIEREDGTRSYPLDGAKDVKVASEYFEENHRRMRPRDRREFAVKVASVAKKGNLKIPEVMSKYASKGYSQNIEAHLTARYLHLVDRESQPEVRDRLIKLARHRDGLMPEDFAESLEAFDREFGLDALWDRDIADPWYSTFCMEKEAKGDIPETPSYDVGETHVTYEELCNLAENGKPKMVELFGNQFANAFERDPSSQFEALPLPQKKLVARMATTFSPTAGV